MRLFQHLIAAAGFAFLATTAAASPANPQSGVDYRTLDKPQQTESGKKVEVMEFFWYNCPHCNAFEPDLEGWIKKQGDAIDFKRVPVAFRESFIPQQKLYYALEAMGKVDAMQAKIFHAIHVEHKSLNTDAEIADYIAQQGIDKQKFLATYNSFGVQSKVRQAAQLMEVYRIDGVPTVTIAGRYITSPSIVSAGNGRMAEPELHAATLKVMDYLVAKAAKEQGPDASQKK
ncbi:MAG: thiol:disulfide interchange protein DsbA/DsbL [Burkholderiaceae bacterium]